MYMRPRHPKPHVVLWQVLAVRGNQLRGALPPIVNPYLQGYDISDNLFMCAVSSRCTQGAGSMRNMRYVLMHGWRHWQLHASQILWHAGPHHMLSLNVQWMTACLSQA